MEHEMRRLLRMIRQGLYSVFFSVILGNEPINAAGAVTPEVKILPGTVTIQGEQISAKINAAPLQQVLAEISRVSGSRVLWLGQSEETLVSVEFPRLPLSEGMKRILGERNFLLFYTSEKKGRKLSQVWISSRERGGQPFIVNTEEIQKSDVPLPPPDSANPRTETESATLIQIALHDPDPFVRLNAVTQLGGYAPEDLGVQTILAQVGQNDIDSRVKETAMQILQDLEQQ